MFYPIRIKGEGTKESPIYTEWLVKVKDLKRPMFLFNIQKSEKKNIKAYKTLNGAVKACLNGHHFYGDAVGVIIDSFRNKVYTILGDPLGNGMTDYAGLEADEAVWTAIKEIQRRQLAVEKRTEELLKRG